ncbi:MAG: hypothetical protein AAGK37_05440 [Pseudomonadota bacterium]
MLATVILGIAAGAGAPYAESHVKRLLEGMLLSDVALSEIELRMLSFAVCLLLASMLAWIFGNGSGFALSFGALLGVFGPRLIERVQKRREPDYGDDV